MTVSRFPEGRPSLEEREVYAFEPYRLDVASRRLTATDGRVVPLTPRGFDLLLALVREADRAVPRSRLLETVWQDVVVEEGNLDTHVSALRKALAELPGAIETVRGYGYRFAASVERQSTPKRPAESERAPAAAVAPSAAGDAPVAPAPPRAAPSRFGRRPAAWAAALAALAVLAASAIALRPRGGPPPPPADGGPHRPILAVLPLENLARRADDAWLATAVREVLSSEVAAGERVTAVPGESVAQLLGRARAGDPLGRELVEKARSELGVELVVRGSYLLVGSQGGLRIDLALEDAGTGRRLAAWNEAGRLDDLLPMLGRAGERLRARLPTAGAIAAGGAGASWQASPEALRLYSEGLVHLREFRPLEAKDLFEQAVVAAPELAQAHAALAASLRELGYERRARQSAVRAAALAPGLPREERLGIEAIERELAGDHPAAADLRSRLAAEQPASVDRGLELARSLSAAGRHDDAHAELDRLNALPPPVGNDLRIELQRGWTARFAGDFDGMRAAGLRAAAAGRELGVPLLEAEGGILIAWADLTLGRHDEGLEACAGAERLATARAHRRFAALGSSLCGWLKIAVGDLDAATVDFDRSLAIARLAGSLQHQVDGLDGLTTVAGGRGAYGEAAHHAEQALAIAREAGSVEKEVDALRALAACARRRGELRRAEELAGQGLALARSIHLASRESWMLAELGLTRLDRGDLASAAEALEESRTRLTGAGPARVAAREIDLAWTALASDRLESAEVLLASARERLPRLGAPTLEQLEIAALGLVAAARRGTPADVGGERAQIEQALAAGIHPATAVRLSLALAESLDREGRGADAVRLLRAGIGRPDWRELIVGRLECELRIAEIEARQGDADALATLETLRARARGLAFGRVLGERL